MDELKGLVFTITHGSFVDGHGIRTTVFLKGCPLRCLWCCNPESQEIYPEIKYTAGECNGCGRCYDLCPLSAIGRDGGRAGIDRNICDNCGSCAEACYRNAIADFAKWRTVDDVFDDVYRDNSFYMNSGGGVTIGGGEPTLQTGFSRALLDRLQSKGVHVAFDTCGYTVSEAAFELLRDADLLLFDLKGLDPEKHKRHTGVDNSVIVENLKKLNDLGKEIIIRLPLIPGFTDDDDDIEAEIDFIGSLKAARRVDIIPYHDFARIKYEQLGRKYPFDIDLVHKTPAEDIRDRFVGAGIAAQIGG